LINESHISREASLDPVKTSAWDFPWKKPTCDSLHTGPEP